MRSLNDVVLEFFIGIRYLVRIVQNRVNLPKRKVISLLSAYLKLFLKHLLYIKILNRNLTIEHIFGWKIKFFSYAAFYCMFKDVFLDHHYFFIGKSKKPLLIDLGTNIGVEIFYYKWLYRKSKILAFEPDKKTFELLKQNVVINNLKNIQLYNMALSDKKSLIKFYCNNEDPGALIMSTKKGRGFSSYVFVKSTTLSTYIHHRVDFLKIDIEGDEYLVVKDLNSTNKLSYVDQLTIEYHHHVNQDEDKLSKLLNLLEKNGFDYHLSSKSHPPFLKKECQDIMIFGYKV